MPSPKFAGYILLVSASALILPLAGCGESGADLAPVTGRVTLDGQPLVGADVMFQPDRVAGSPSIGVTDEDGRYKLSYKRDVTGAQIGMHRIIINEKRGAKPLPPRYNVKTELRQEVKAGEDNEIDFDLKFDPK